MKKFDKMDLIVILLTGLALSYLLTSKSPAPAQAVEASLPAVAAETKSAKATATATDQAPAPEAPQFVEFATPAAKYVFTTAGGGLRSTTLSAGPYAGKIEQPLNDKGDGPIGSLSRLEGDVDVKPWAIKDRTEKGLTFTTTTKDGLVIDKVWSLVDSADDPLHGTGYLWNLSVKFKNTGTETFASDDYSLYTGASTQIHAMDAYVSVGSFADGKGAEIKAAEFDEDRALWVLWQRHPAQTTVVRSLSQTQWVSVNSQYYSTIISSTAKDKADSKLWAKRFNLKLTEDGKDHEVKGLHAGLGLPVIKLEAGKEVAYDYQVFTGPRSGTLLGKINETREENMFYGFTGGLSKLFLFVLNKFHSWTGSFGLAVIFLTICVRIIIWPLHLKSTRSMKRMALVGQSPEALKIKEKYLPKPNETDAQRAENQRKVQMENMGLYREFGVNPLGGCLPLLLQMPIFFGYFGMLNHAVEMRGHSFLWAHDLMLPDTVFHLFGFPINPLPLLMTITMLIQMKLQPTPAAADENQRMQMKMMKFMPLMFLVFCYNYASALALYWTVQNIVSIIQTVIVKRMPEPQLTKRAVSKLPSVSGAGNRSGAGREPEKPKPPGPPRIGGGGKSAFKS